MPPARNAYDGEIPPVVLAAVGLLALLFLSGGIFLVFSGVFKTPLDISPAIFPETSVMVAPYAGTLWGVKPALEKMKASLNRAGLLCRETVVIYPQTALKLRPIAVRCQIGFVAALSSPPSNLPAGVQWRTLARHPCIRVRIPGQGLYSGMRAYRSAQRRLGDQKNRLAEGERYELWTLFQGRPCVEHWLPVNPD